jgi:hypothetical protein
MLLIIFDCEFSLIQTGSTNPLMLLWHQMPQFFKYQWGSLASRTRWVPEREKRMTNDMLPSMPPSTVLHSVSTGNFEMYYGSMAVSLKNFSDLLATPVIQ